jgi:hypothetical protein
VNGSATTARSAGEPGTYGVRVAGVGLLLPQSLSLEYLPSAPVYPLPRVRARVRGLVQVRGQPLVVLDPGPAGGSGAARRLPLLVIGEAPDGAAVVVDAPPEAVVPGASLPGAERPEVPFADALGEACADSGRAGAVWWRFDPRRLFETLSGL